MISPAFSGRLPAVFATAFVGCLISCASVSAQLSSVTLDDPQISGDYTMSIGFKLAELKTQPMLRPKKRPLYIEFVSAEFNRPQRRTPTSVGHFGGLPDAMAVVRRPDPILANETLPRNEPPVAELTGERFRNLVGIRPASAAGSSISEIARSSSVTHSRTAAVNSGVESEQPQSLMINPFTATIFHASHTAGLTDRPRRRPASIEELICLADVMYFEARGEGEVGRHAVAVTVLNRVRSKRFPNTICGVVKQGEGELHKCQFSYYCDGHPERIHELRAYREIKETARRILESGTIDRTGGATYFHSVAVSPSWAKHMQLTAKIGQHVFYRESN